VLELKPEVTGSKMSRISVALLLISILLLTGYFAAAAWRASDERHTESEITGRIPADR